MIFKTAAIALLLPPVSLVFVALIGLWTEHRHRAIGRFLVWFGVLGLLVLALPAVSGLLLTSLERNLPLTPPPDRPPQAIVVLGGDTQRDGRPTPVAHLGPLSLERVRTAALLHRRTGLPILVTGGTLRTSEPPVAVLMADSLVHDFEVPARWIERESRDTWENARLSADILHQQHITSVYVVTQAWHMRRAVLAFADTGIAVTAAPTLLHRVPVSDAGDFVPGVGGWRDSYYALHEWIGWVWYLVR